MTRREAFLKAMWDERRGLRSPHPTSPPTQRSVVPPSTSRSTSASWRPSTPSSPHPSSPHPTQRSVDPSSTFRSNYSWRPGPPRTPPSTTQHRHQPHHRREPWRPQPLTPSSSRPATATATATAQAWQTHKGAHRPAPNAKILAAEKAIQKQWLDAAKQKQAAELAALGEAEANQSFQSKAEEQLQKEFRAAVEARVLELLSLRPWTTRPFVSPLRLLLLHGPFTEASPHPPSLSLSHRS